MKKASITIVVAFIVLQLYSQDYIETIKGEIYNCKIITDDSTSYTIKLSISNRDMETRVNKNDIAKVVPGYYDVDFRGRKIKQGNPTPWRATVNFGYGYVIGRLDESVPVDLEGYVNSLRNGLVINADYHLFINPDFGIGVVYTSHYASVTNKQNVSVFETSVTPGNMESNVARQYMGPSVIYKWPVNREIDLYSTTGITYAFYKDNARFKSRSYTITANTLAYHFSTNAEINLNKHFALTLGARLYWGAYNKFTLEFRNDVEEIELEDGKRESMSMIELTLGLGLKN